MAIYFDYEAEKRERRLALKRERTYDEELLRGLRGRTHAESVHDFLAFLGCLDVQSQGATAYESQAKEYAH
jgi:hypothetical protein